MIRLTRPSGDDIVRYRQRAVEHEPGYPATGDFHELERSRVVGAGSADYEAAKRVLREWQMHIDAGVCVDPVPLSVGETVVLWTRPLGFWLLFACRVIDVVDSATDFGFTYATLPDHPEQGHESFVTTLEPDGSVAFRIRAVSRPAALLARLSGPIGRGLQRRYTDNYLDAVHRRVNRSRG